MKKKIQKDSADFSHRKMTLKVRIVLFSTVHSKTTERPKIFLWPFSQFLGLAYSPLNSATCRKITLGTLSDIQTIECNKVLNKECVQISILIIEWGCQLTGMAEGHKTFHSAYRQNIKCQKCARMSLTWISHKINFPHPGTLKKFISWEPFWSYHLTSTANPAHLPQNWAKLTKLAVLFSWQLQNCSQDFDFFNCNGCRIFILYEIH